MKNFSRPNPVNKYNNPRLHKNIKANAHQSKYSNNTTNFKHNNSNGSFGLNQNQNFANIQNLNSGSLYEGGSGIINDPKTNQSLCSNIQGNYKPTVNPSNSGESTGTNLSITSIQGVSNGGNSGGESGSIPQVQSQTTTNGNGSNKNYSGYCFYPKKRTTGVKDDHYKHINHHNHNHNNVNYNNSGSSSNQIPSNIGNMHGFPLGACMPNFNSMTNMGNMQPNYSNSPNMPNVSRYPNYPNLPLNLSQNPFGNASYTPMPPFFSPNTQELYPEYSGSQEYDSLDENLKEFNTFYQEQCSFPRYPQEIPSQDQLNIVHDHFNAIVYKQDINNTTYQSGVNNVSTTMNDNSYVDNNQDKFNNNYNNDELMTWNNYRWYFLKATPKNKGYYE